MMSSNIERLKIIAQGLGELCGKVVFVGGSVAELYADDAASTDMRPTMDVDCIVQINTYGNLEEFEAMLRQRHFVNDIESGVICRWKYRGEIVDIMPDDAHILGFTNRWYQSGIKHKVTVKIDGDLSIDILHPMYYIATKIEAIRNRGGEDLRFSHDFEDLIYVLNNRQNIVRSFQEITDTSLRRYIIAWAKEILNRRNVREEIECALPYGEDERIGYIFSILEEFAGTAA